MINKEWARHDFIPFMLKLKYLCGWSFSCFSSLRQLLKSSKSQAIPSTHPAAEKEVRFDPHYMTIFRMVWHGVARRAPCMYSSQTFGLGSVVGTQSTGTSRSCSNAVAMPLSLSLCRSLLPPDLFSIFGLEYRIHQNTTCVSEVLKLSTWVV